MAPSSDLRATLQDELLPRMTLADGAPSTGLVLASDACIPPTREEVALLAGYAAEQNLMAALGLIAQRVGQGLSHATILLLLVAPAARLLNEQWDTEERTFAEVMEGLKVLQHVADALRPSVAPTP